MNEMTDLLLQYQAMMLETKKQRKARLQTKLNNLSWQQWDANVAREAKSIIREMDELDAEQE